MTARAAGWAAAVLAAAAIAHADAPAGPRVAVEPAAFDFGSARPRKVLQKEIAVRNFGDAELVIRKVSTSCGCTVAGGYATRVAPGAGTTLRISFTTPAAAGRTEQTVSIESNDRERPKVEVKVSAMVVTGKRDRAPEEQR